MNENYYEVSVNLPERDIDTVTSEINALKGQILCSYLEIGRRLVEAKELLPHGEWGTWLEEKVEFSKSTANNLMRLFGEYGSAQSCLFGTEPNRQALGNLTYTNALKLLTVPAEEREEFAAEHDVEHMSSRELDAAIKERDEARRREEEARKRAEAAESAKKTSEEAQADLQAKLKKAEFEASQAEGSELALAEKQDLIEKLKAELAELKARPIDVAVERDEAAITEAAEKARADAEAESAERIAELEEKIKAAQLEKDKLADENTVAKAKAEAAEVEVQAAKAEAEKLRKAAAMSDATTVKFKTLFEEVQGTLERLLGMADEAGENKSKLLAGLGQLCDTVKERCGA